MADRVACRLTDRIKAAAIVSGTSSVGGPCKPSRPISVAIVHGSGDSTFPYKAAEQAGRGMARSRWMRAGGEYREPLGDSATIRRASRMPRGATVEFVTVQGGGHSWFGNPDATTVVVGVLRGCRSAMTAPRYAMPTLAYGSWRCSRENR